MSDSFISLDDLLKDSNICTIFKDMKLERDINNKENIPPMILNFLEDKGAIDEDSAISPQSIAKYIFGKKATKKMVNPQLYKMLKDGTVKKITEDDMKRPRWYLLVSP